jgi:hypothetical protein
VERGATSPAPALDRRRDCAAIARELGTIALPWDTTRSRDLALSRTFASPRIGPLLYRTDEFDSRTQKRYDDRRGARLSLRARRGQVTHPLGLAGALTSATVPTGVSDRSHSDRYDAETPFVVHHAVGSER